MFFFYSNLPTAPIRVADVDDFSTTKRYQNFISVEGGNNYIYNSNIERSTVRTGDGNDTIITGGEGGYYNSSNPRPSIVAGAGDNRITVNTAMYYGSVFAGDGDDLVSITGNGNNNIISVGGGNDSVFTDGNNLVVDVGDGDNFVTLGGEGSGYNNIYMGTGNNTRGCW